MSVIGFRALQLANEQQSAYGLRYDDFVRYRKHCANRTHRLRSTLKITHSSPKGRDFKKIPPITSLDLSQIKDAHLQLLLLESERAWAYSQELSNLSLKPSNASHAASLRHHSTGRFRRALNWAFQLLSVSQSLYSANPRRLSAQSLLECTAYVFLLNGRFLLTRDDHESALQQLCVTKYILDSLLAENAKTSRDKALAVLWSDQVGPLIRWSAHQLGREKAYDVDGIVQQVAVEKRAVSDLVEGWDDIVKTFKAESEKELGRGQGGGGFDEKKLLWEGEKVPVRNPELVDVLVKVQAAEAKLTASANRVGGGKKAVAAYDSILAALSDAEEVARKLSESEAQKASSSTIPTSFAGGGGNQIRDMHFVHTYIVYQLLSKRIQRDLLLLEALNNESQSTSKLAMAAPSSSRVTAATSPIDPRLQPALVKLLDSILQSLSQMRTLSIVDDNPDLANNVETRIGWTKAKRCLSLARCYVTAVPNTVGGSAATKYPEALTLLQHASLHLRETRQLASITTQGDEVTILSEIYPIPPTSLDLLENDIAKEGLEYKRVWLESGSEDAKKKKKPIFFNIALNYIDLDVEKLRSRAGMAAPSSVPSTTVSSSAQHVIPASVVSKKALAEDTTSRSGTPEPRSPDPTMQEKANPTGTGGGSRLGSLLGGWWGRS